ncbi:type III secretion system chaperone [uncultured Shewanella sp.]|uniref:type III secretion system chaperone n=1 Tax=uncultured Shewanella sp. TaxID=173975 RepID=UPI0026078FE9|nr:type III secretion system chaperone [uncultured Shewanella sp.]
MYNVKQIDMMFSEVGALIDAQSIIKLDEQHWKIVFAEGKEVNVIHTPDSHKLTLESSIGSSAVTLKEAFYTLLLEYNYCWRDTGGIRMAMYNDNLIQLFDLFTQELSVNILVDVLLRFSERLNVWSEMLSEFD